MLRSQKDVDKHVQDIFRKITNEKERNLRCYNVAKLYQKVGDHQSTKQYVELYLKDRPKVAGAHKLLGQALEGLKEYSKALEEYKCSLTLEHRQPDLVLKVCELLVETKTGINAGEAKYWIEKAEEVADNHHAVFRLKEYLLKMDNGSGDNAQLAQLIEREIEARPLDHVPRIRLLNLFLDSKKVIDAYKYAIELEGRNLFRDNLQWYTCVVEVIKAYQKESTNLNGEFYINLLSILERHVTLCFRDQVGVHSSNVSNALFAFDEACHEAFKYSERDGNQLLLECLRHMGGQLCFHLGAAWLRIGKQSRSTGWKECTPYAWALLALAYSPPATADATSHNTKDKVRRHLKLWKEDAAFRCTQAGHILLSMPRDQQLERFSQCNSGNWRGKVFSMLFPVQSKNKPDAQKSSFFITNDRFADIPEVSPSLRDIALHDEIGQHHRPDSLHALVWLGLRHLEPPSKNVSPFGMPYILPFKLSPSFACHVFEEMKLSTINLETGGVETLSRLDIDTFLYASVFCAAAAQDERNFWGDGRPSVLPVDLTDTLCSDAQSKWWLNTYKLHSNKSRSDIGEVRMVVSRGLEVVRLLGNHGMDVRLVVLLAKVFTEKASALITPKENIPDISKRAFLFWQCAITLLERMERNHPLRVSGNPMFVYGGKDLTPSEIKMLLEEGRFFMACRLMKEDKYEEAIEAFQDLKNPYASFYEGLMYKKLADAELMSLPPENVSAEMKSKYTILLQKSLSALHLTLDRLRSPQNAGNHPLSLELEQHLQEVENCLMREDSNFVFSIVNRNPQDNVLDDSFTSNRFDDSIQNVSRFVNTSTHFSLLPNVNVSRVNGQGLTSTPFKGKRNIDFIANLDASPSQRLEARPSPERLDAQMRRMTITTDAVMQVVVEQNRQMLDLNKTMMDALEKTRASVEDLQKQMSDLKLEVGKLKVGDNRQQSGKNVDYSNMAARGAEVYDYDVAASQFHPTRGYPPTASYGHFPGQGYTYDNCAAANNIHPMPSMVHLLPQAQMPLSRNMDPNLLLASYYPQAMGHNFSDRQTGIPISNTMPGQIATPGQSNVPVAGVPASVDAASVDSFRKTSLIGTPIISHTTNHPIDLCAPTSISSVSQPLLPTVDISAQRFNMGTQPGLSHGGKTSTSTVDTLPHNFQISMPPQATIPTTESLEKSLSPLKPISTDSILPNVPMPTYSAVSAKGSDLKVSRHSTGSASGNDTFTEDADYNPCADFKPIIPLPEEITVTTGEEDETVLFVRRAKLFRFVAGEWKERGVGDIKILKHNITGKPRILMRREQVHKICANHFILPEMELSAQKGSDRAWNWGANDFSDGEACIEKLCVRFKTVEDAEQFKTAFDDARKLAKNATPVKGPSTAVSKPEDKTTTPGSQGSTAPAAKVELGGFSFISPPVLKPVERQVKTSPGKDKENVAAVSKPSPFAGFSFTPSTTNAFGSATSLAGSSFVSTSTAAFGSVSSSSSTLFGQKVSPSVTSSATASTDKLMFNNSNSLLDFAAIAAQSKGSEVGKKDSNFKGFAGAGSKVFGGTVSKVSDGNVSSSNDSKTTDQDASADGDEFEPTAVFNPVIPLPSLVEVRTGEEDEEILFAERAKLLRFDASMKEWKERGVGKMKILKNPSTGKVRLLMRREQVLKVCCNHFITKDLQFKLMTTSDKAITWSAQDFAEGEVSVEVFALRFKSPELMHAFKDVVESVQSSISDSATNSPASAPKPSTNKDAQPLTELFKPKAGSWECTGCYTRNGAEVTSCPCCSQPKPGCEAKVAESKSATNTSFSFGIKTNSTDDVKSSTGFTFGNTTTAPLDKPLSELFKPKEGSWSCAGCYTINGAEQLTCPCCSQPQPGSEAKVAESKSSQNSSFLFGVKPTSSDQPKVASGFAFGNITTDAKDKTPLSELFKPKEGSWSCDACYTRCDADATACVACEAPKPGHENDKKAAGSTFSFGMPSAPAASFSFGVAPTGEVKSSFSFGLPTSTAAGAEKGFSFGAGTQPSSTSTSGFTFGASTLTPNQPSFASLASSQPSFGSPHKFEFHMKAQSPAKSPGKSPGAPSGEEDSDDDHVEENPDVGDFKPVVPLPDKVPVVTGEEEETALYCHRAKLYRFVTGEGGAEWKERGLGDIKVLRHNVTNKPRLLMRREQVLKICLNHYISSDLELKQKDEKTWMWHAQDFSEGVLAPEQFACRFKTAEIAADFAAAVEEAKKLTVLPSPGAGTTPIRSKDESSAKSLASTQNTPNTVSSDKPGVVRSLFGSSNQSSSASDEVEVVYEAKVTPEEKSAALKLLLPENFYRYKQAPPCEGCPGCEKDSDSDQGDKQSSVDSSKAPANTSASTFSFGSSSPAFGSGGTLFSSASFSSPSSTIFGGSAKTASTASIFGGASNLNLGTTPSSLFGGTSSSNSTATIFGGTSSSIQAPVSSSLFGGISSKSTSVTPTVGSLFGAGTASAGLGSTAVNSPSTAFPILGSLTTASKEEKSEKSEGVSFLPVGNSPSFASLAAANSSGNASGNVFKLGNTSNQSFAFDGAGAKVFGGVSSVALSKKNNEEEGDSGGEHDTTEVETHDPHFEPIIAMPDIIEVRTGEEDEEKVFCRRAKLFRFDGKEWKERGVGEMKILKHPLNGTFRLLLRREQVYKVVLNQRLHADMELVPLNTSDKAWCWGGINHAEDPEGVVEKLAVRFKNSEEADEFRLKLEECQKMIVKVPGQVVKEGDDEDEEEEDEDDDDYEDDENAYEDEEGEFEILFEKPAALVAEIEGVENSAVEGKGAIRIVLLPNHSYVVEMEDVSGQVLCRAPITGDVEVSRDKNICTWKSFDHAEDYEQGIDKKFVTTFESESDAESFQDYYSKYTLEIVERSYDYVDEQED